MTIFEILRSKGLKCNCTDCDDFGCDYCTVCKLDEDEEEALKLLNDINTIEAKYGVVISILNDSRNKGLNLP